jgi:hypothetical protein
MADEPKNVGEILDRIDEIANEGDVSLGHVAEAMGTRAHGPFLMVPALIDISPVGSIPGLPTLLAVVIVITAVQLLFGGRTLWLPGILARRSLSNGKARKTTEKLRGVARFLDRWFHSCGWRRRSSSCSPSPSRRWSCSPSPPPHQWRRSPRSGWRCWCATAC